jgi:hypothetical protein
MHVRQNIFKQMLKNFLTFSNMLIICILQIKPCILNQNYFTIEGNQ